MRKKIGKIVFFVLVALLIYKLTGSVLEYKQALEQQKKYIPSPTELQQLLKNTDNPRYDCGPADGAIGPLTLEAWDNYICDRYASKCDWYYEK